MKDSKVKWAISLSNGETVYEDKGDYRIIKGEISPWQKLLKFIDKQGVRITSLSLYMDDGRRWNLPSAGRNPKFKEFADAEKPISYRFFRKAGIDMDFDGGNRKEEIYTVAEAIYKDKKLQVWVPEENPEVCWSVIVK
ncbi:MAG: hypothetical protein ACKKMS_00115 [Candidatus Nealsonbacteria bacterium]